MGLIFDEELDVEEIHYQMVKLHQNLKHIQMQKEQWKVYLTAYFWMEWFFDWNNFFKWDEW